MRSEAVVKGGDRKFGLETLAQRLPAIRCSYKKQRHWSASGTTFFSQFLLTVSIKTKDLSRIR